MFHTNKRVLARPSGGPLQVKITSPDRTIVLKPKRGKALRDQRRCC